MRRDKKPCLRAWPPSRLKMPKAGLDMVGISLLKRYLPAEEVSR